MRNLLCIAARHLSGPVASTLCLEPDGVVLPQPRRSSSTFATFDSLTYDAIYYRGELPLEIELQETSVSDAAWARLGPVPYDTIAHLLIPRFFTQEIFADQGPGRAPHFVDEWTHEQDINGLSDLLRESGIEHRLTDQVIEVRRF